MYTLPSQIVLKQTRLTSNMMLDHLVHTFCYACLLRKTKLSLDQMMSTLAVYITACILYSV